MMLAHAAPDAYAYMYLGSLRSPVVKITGHDRKPKWDVKQATAQVGASSTLVGQEIGQFRANFYLVDDDDMAVWFDFRDLAKSTTAGPKPIALPVWHPDLADNDYTEAAQNGISGLTWDDKGGASCWIDFIEYRPAKAKPSATAKGASSTAKGKDKKADPNAAAKAELGKLLDEASKP